MVGSRKENLANGLMVHKSHDGWQAGMETTTTTTTKLWKKGVGLFFLAIYSQKDFFKIKIKIAKIKCFLRFSVARIPPKFK
jgi:hypothetical protein